MPGLFYLIRSEIQYRLFQVERIASKKKAIQYTAPLSGPAPADLHSPSLTLSEHWLQRKAKRQLGSWTVTF